MTPIWMGCTQWVAIDRNKTKEERQALFEKTKITMTAYVLELEKDREFLGFTNWDYRLSWKPDFYNAILVRCNYNVREVRK